MLPSFAIDEAGGSFERGRGVRERRRGGKCATRGANCGICVKRREGGFVQRCTTSRRKEKATAETDSRRQRDSRTRHKYENWVARRTSKDYYYYSEAGSAQALPLSLSHGHAAAAKRAQRRLISPCCSSFCLHRSAASALVHMDSLAIVVSLSCLLSHTTNPSPAFDDCSRRRSYSLHAPVFRVHVRDRLLVLPARWHSFYH